MKLYFYFIDESYKEPKTEFRIEECEVVERPKTYKAVDRFPRGYYGGYVKKEDLEKTIEYSKNIVILLERDDEKAINIFVKSLNFDFRNKSIDYNKFVERVKRRLNVLGKIDEMDNFIKNIKEEQQ